MRRLRDYRNAHAGETILVCGCGASLAQLPREPRVVTIGVNDVGRHFDPTYLVVLNARSQFKPDRFRYVESSRAGVLFSQLDLGVRHPYQVRFRLGRRGGTELPHPEQLPFTRNSPYVALCLALHLGAARVGVIGVDFTDHHFFAETGRHPLARNLRQIDGEYRRLAEVWSRRGVEIVNLSAESRLKALPKVTLESFLAAARDATTPLEKPPSARPRPAPSPPPRERKTVMRVAIEQHKPGIVGDFLDGLAEGAGKLGHQVVRSPTLTSGRRDTVSIVWNGRRHRSQGRTLYCEHAWLPRWEYQISAGGINADHHAAPFVWTGEPLTATQLAELEAHLDLIRQGGPSAFSYMQTRAPALEDLPPEFLLVPLQMEWDTNIQRHVPARFRRMQALVDAVSAFDPPYPIVFKQHPADLRRGNRQLRLRLPRQEDRVRRHAAGNIHQLLKSGRCKGIVSLNSNVVHDGMLWDVPAIVLGKNLWPRQGEEVFLTGPPADWAALEALTSDPRHVAARRAYAYFLMKNQWTLEQSRLPERVEALLASVGSAASVPATSAPAPDAARNATPPAIRPRMAKRHPARIAARARGLRRATPRTEPAVTRRTAGNLLVNVAALNKGWFFEDLKGHFERAEIPGISVVASDRPRSDADAWVMIRTQEAATSPDLSRTLVQVHDMYDHGLYKAGGRRAAVRGCGALALTHPEQRRILEASGVQVAGRPTLDRPIGALAAFAERRALPDQFTVGWIGRPVRHRGQDLKRVDCVIQAIRRLEGEVRVVLLGERLEGAHRALRGAGIATTYHQRARTPIEKYPALYQGLDCVAIYSKSEAGPLCLFEALASGVPVVSSAVGWAPRLLREGENGFVVSTVAEMARALERIRVERRAWFERRAAIRASLGGHTLEGWVAANLERAGELARAAAA